MPSKTPLRWTLQSLLPQIALRRAARRGQLGAQLAVDRTLWADPYPAYEAMRDRGPLLRDSLVSSTASHAVASEVLRSPIFGVGLTAPDRLPSLPRRLHALAADPWAVLPAEPPSMLAVDPPDHTRLRRLVSKVFTPRAMAAMVPRVEAITEELLDEMARHDTVDLVEAYAAPLPVRVISEILGIPRELQPQVLAWGNDAAVTLDPALRYRQFRDAVAGLREMHRWLDEHLRTLRRQPGDDLLSRLARLEDEGETLTDVELRTTALLVIGAGFETTVNLISNGVALLLAAPEQLAALRADPERWPNAVEEVLRFDAPVQATVRIANAATTLAGQDLPENHLVSIMLGGANRDPEVFADPQRFDIRRPNARDHLAFSAGIHYCLGASLARLEGAVALRALFERFPDLAATGTPVRRPLRVLRGYDHFPVRPGPRQPVS
jgi:cytochrome P450